MLPAHSNIWSGNHMLNRESKLIALIREISACLNDGQLERARLESMSADWQTEPRVGDELFADCFSRLEPELEKMAQRAALTPVPASSGIPRDAAQMTSMGPF